MDDEEEREPRPFGVISAALFTIGAVLVTALFAEIADAIRPGALADPVTGTLARVLGVSLALFGIARIHAPDAPLHVTFGLTRPKPVYIFLAIIIGLSLCISLSWVDDRIAAHMPAKEDTSDALEKILASPQRRVFLAFAVMFVLPICDEVLYRGAIFTGLRKTRPLLDTAITTVLLESLTGGVLSDQRTAGSTLGFAAAATFLRAASGSAVVTVVARVAFYSSVLLVVWKPEWAKLEIPGTYVAASAGIAALGLLAVWRLAITPARALEEPEKNSA